MAAYAALVSLLNNMEQMMNHPRLSNSLDKKQIQTLEEKAGFLLDIIEGNNYGGDSKEAANLERQIASAAHAAEDVIESHIVDQIHAGTICFLDLQHILDDMDVVVEKAAEVKAKHAFKEEEQLTHSTPLTEAGETAMVGFDDELIQLMDKLTNQRSSRHIISIVGMGGMGKTTLAKNVYANPLIIEHFDIRAWATVSQQYNVQEILSQLISGQGKSSGRSADELGEELYKTLSGRRYLIVLDDLWSIEAWDKVRCFFPDNGSRSRVILTTRLSNVASVCGSSCFKMNLLDEDTSWKLFCEKALFPHKDDPLQLEDVGKEMVRLCKGLALSIVVIGGLLRNSPRSVKFWNKVARNIRSVPDSKEKQESLNILSLSYDHLPPHLKPCFLYMGVFEEDSEIRVSNITKLWIAEGFIKPNGTQVLEEIAEGYLKDLIDRNLILVGRSRCNGKIGSCGIHDLLRDLCIKVAKEEEFFHVTIGGEIRGTEHRLISDRYQTPIRPSSLARSILTSTFLPQLVNYRLLRVLNEAYYESLAALHQNLNLRYLVYNQSHRLHLWKLPTSLPLVWNLQTLIVKGVIRRDLDSPVTVAPSEIWKMRQLRHVECKHIHLPDPPPSNGEEDAFILENLQTLTTAVNLRSSEEVCKIIPNVKKLHLVISRDLQGYGDSLIECLRNLDRLHKLESLKMEIKGSRWPFPDTEMSKKLGFSTSLNKLSLSFCQLHWDDLTMIGSLPQLQVLNLEHDSVTEGEKWSPVDGQFLNLKFLKIENCRLFCWDADSSHFPKLEKLLLIELKHLKEIPLVFGEIPTLGLIRVDWCRETAAISAMRIKEDQLENQENDALQIQVKIQDSNLEGFKTCVETEGLALNYIQLETSIKNVL